MLVREYNVRNASNVGGGENSDWRSQGSQGIQKYYAVRNASNV